MEPQQYSKTLNVYLDRHVDILITVCDAANEACPYFPKAAKRLHWSFPDPSKAIGSEEEQLQTYRNVRDAITKRIQEELMVMIVN